MNETLMMIQAKMLNGSAIVYLIATALYIAFLGKRSPGISKAATIVGIIGVLMQTVGLIVRWIVGGWDHPPFTNLYESLVFFAWGIVGFYLYMEWRYKANIAGAFVFPVALAAMFLAVTHTEQGINPLPDALKSWWLHAHVIFASVAYAAFVVAFAYSLMYLIKDKVKRESFGAVVAGIVAFVLILVLYVRGGGNLSIFAMKQMTMMGGEMVPIMIEGAQGNEYAFQAIPGVGPLLLATFAILLIAAIMYFMQLKNPSSMFEQASGGAISLAAITISLALLAIFLQASKLDNVTIKGEPYLIALLFFMWLLVCGMVMFHYLNPQIVERLPEIDKLDFLSYRSVMVAFPLMTIVIVTGAVWAQSAWGRYWGWDPKETASLVTWFVYAIYLHSRIVAGWKGRPSSIISIIGFLSVVFTYLGVNVFLSGLHSYGSN